MSRKKLQYHAAAITRPVNLAVHYPAGGGEISAG